MQQRSRRDMDTVHREVPQVLGALAVQVPLVSVGAWANREDFGLAG